MPLRKRTQFGAFEIEHADLGGMAGGFAISGSIDYSGNAAACLYPAALALIAVGLTTRLPGVGWPPGVGWHRTGSS